MLPLFWAFSHLTHKESEKSYSQQPPNTSGGRTDILDPKELRKSVGFIGFFSETHSEHEPETMNRLTIQNAKRRTKLRLI
jgi:hypothetical protein